VNNPPEVIVKIFDKDQFGPPEFMGKCFVKPFVHDELDKPPKLKWYNVFCGNERAGDILGSFELIRTSGKADEFAKTLILLDSFPVPKVKTYTLEVMISI
jgi:hypothetical protein